jgi:integrase
MHVNLTHDDRGTTETTPKSHEARSVPLNDDAATVLAEHKLRCKLTGEDDPVFPGEMGGVLCDDRLRGRLDESRKAAGVPLPQGKIIHDLRHTYGTYMTAATGDLWRVEAWMGHSSVTVTEIYAHHLPKHDDAAEQSAGLARLRKREAA